MCEKIIMKKSELKKKLFEENRIHVRFHSEDFKDIIGYQELILDLATGDLKPQSRYPEEIRKWLDYYGINLNEIEDD